MIASSWETQVEEGKWVEGDTWHVGNVYTTCLFINSRAVIREH